MRRIKHSPWSKLPTLLAIPLFLLAPGAYSSFEMDPPSPFRLVDELHDDSYYSTSSLYQQTNRASEKSHVKHNPVVKDGTDVPNAHFVTRFLQYRFKPANRFTHQVLSTLKTASSL
jgi:hypothetical protein